MNKVYMISEEDMEEIIKNISITRCILHDVSMDISINEKSRLKIDNATETMDKVVDLLQ